jgi:pectinesterase
MVLLLASGLLQAAERFTVTVRNQLNTARPAQTIVIPYDQVKARLPHVVFDQVIVRDHRGAIIPSQVTSFVHSHKGPQQFNELIFQHDFAAGEKAAMFTVEASDKAIAPYPSRIFIRYVPERFDDFAWENDLVAHRAYGPALELPSAGKDQMVSSGLDLWSKRARYSVIDHWYHKGHDGLHTDTGDGLDMYETGMNRGAGGTGIWDDHQLRVSKNWRSWKILANGPLRGVFELSYDPWDAGNGVMVSETKRFTVDAGHYLDAVQSTFTFTGAADATLTVAIALTRHDSAAQVAATQHAEHRYISLWEEYRDAVDGKLGTAIILSPTAQFAGFASLPGNPSVPRLSRDESMLLATVHSGVPVSYEVGGGWDKGGDFHTQSQWLSYLEQQVANAASPLSIELSAMPTK